MSVRPSDDHNARNIIATPAQRAEARALLRRAAAGAARSGNAGMLAALEQEGLPASILLDAAVTCGAHELVGRYLDRGVRPTDETLGLAASQSRKMREAVLAHHQPKPVHILYAVMAGDSQFLDELLGVHHVPLCAKTVFSLREWLAPRFGSPTHIQVGRNLASVLVNHMPATILSTATVASTLSWVTSTQLSQLMGRAPRGSVQLDRVLAEAFAVNRIDHVRELLRVGAQLHERVVLRALCASRRAQYQRAPRSETAALLASCWAKIRDVPLRAPIVARGARLLLEQHTGPLQRYSCAPQALAQLMRLVSVADTAPLQRALKKVARRLEGGSGGLSDREALRALSIPEETIPHGAQHFRALVEAALALATQPTVQTPHVPAVELGGAPCPVG
jgi:hypothetical protein